MGSPKSAELRLEALSESTLNDFKTLLGSTDFGGCFCAVWTSFGPDWPQRCNDPTQPNYFITEKNIQAGRHVGYLVFEDDNLVGWTGSGPKTAFPQLQTKLGSRLSDFSKEIWSIGCLAVAVKFRGRNLAESIAKAVISEARHQGAHFIEAYPVRPFHEPRIFRGSYSMYQRLGFCEIGCEKDGEFDLPLMQLTIARS